MPNFKKISDLPVAKSTDGLNLVVNDNGFAKQIAADSVGKVKSVNNIEPDNNGNVHIDTSGNVKTVNGVNPDESGNVQIDTASSWNDLKDKPFYAEESVIDIFTDETFTLEAEEPSGVVFVSQTKHKLEEGTVCNFIINGIAHNDIVIANGQTRFEGYTVWNGGTGLVIIYAPVGTASLTASLSVKEVTVKQIEEKYIPNEVKGLVFEIADSECSQDGPDEYIITKNYDALYETIMSGRHVYIRIYGQMYTPLSIWFSDGFGLSIKTYALGPNEIGYNFSQLNFINGSYHGQI